jgi:titin
MTFLLDMWREAMSSRAALSARNRRRAMRTHPTRFAPRIEPLEDRRLLSVYAVINTSDSGEGSLRQAILDANAHTSEANTIIFDIRGQGPQTIRPLTALPAITNPLTIDATFQPGYAGSPLIDLDGHLTYNVEGLTITADNSVVRGLGITFFLGNNHAGVRLQGNGDHIEGCYVVGNENGVLTSGSDDVIGGTGAGAGNLISHNNNDGIDIFGDNNVVQGNTIGTDITGTQRLGNGYGVFINHASGNLIGGTAAGAGNLVSGNDYGIFIAAGDNTLVQGNLIGTDITGTSAVANGHSGIFVGGSGNTIGGTSAGAGNLVSGNLIDGIQFQFFAGTNNLVQGNLIGTDITGTQALGNGGDGVFLDADGDTIGGTAAGAGNLISGNTFDGIDIPTGINTTIQGNKIGTDITGTQALGNRQVGLFADSGGNTIGGTATGAGNLISGNRLDGIELLGSGTGNLVQGNLIGTDITGTQALGNAYGVVVGAGGNTIGGTAAGAGNLISANFEEGIYLDGAGNIVQGDLIGTDITGTQALGNRQIGMFVDVYSGGDTIGGTAAGAGNLISGNFQGNIELLGSGNLVQGNLIGTDITGAQALGKGGDGVFVGFGANTNTIGGTVAGAGNLISGNQRNGIELNGSGNLVQGNRIGTDVTGTQVLGNGLDGVFVGSAGNPNTIGGTAAGAGNLISGNAFDGIELGGGNNLVQCNRIGTDITGTQALGNARMGVFVGAGGDTIGGTAVGAGNLISGNGGDGIELAGGLDLVQGDLIGTDITGTQALGNGFDGVADAGGSLDTIGGTAAGAGNLISGNARDGIEIVYGFNNTIQGNNIGTDFTGTQALANGRNGITLIASSTTVGGTTAAAANIIAANGGSGVVISGVEGYGRFSLIEGNFIGTDASATLNLGNAADGVTINQNASNNTIGGTASGAGNVIAFNGHDGVLVDSGTGNAILSDLIFANGNLGIELINSANHNQVAPLLTGAFPDGPDTVIQGVLQSTPNTTFTVQLFADPSADASGSAEGQQLLGTVTVTTDAFGFAAFTVTVPDTVAAGQVITATATDASNNTSEFSAPMTVMTA